MDFQTAFPFVIDREGGYVNDPRDPGGETKFGISKRAYPHIDIANLTLDIAKAIYERDYWNAMKCNSLPARIRLAVFDSAVNHGNSATRILLQLTAKVRRDGVIGPKTLRAIKNEPVDEFLVNFLAHRALFYARIKTFQTYGKGWMRRLFHVALADKGS
jgi:lysozyme family protein